MSQYIGNTPNPRFGVFFVVHGPFLPVQASVRIRPLPVRRWVPGDVARMPSRPVGPGVGSLWFPRLTGAAPMSRRQGASTVPSSVPVAGEASPASGGLPEGPEAAAGHVSSWVRWC